VCLTTRYTIKAGPLWLNTLEELIASTARIKILKVLSKQPDMRMKDFLCKVGGKSGEAYRNLARFEKADVITSEYGWYGNRKTRTVHLMIERPRTQALLKAIKILAEAENNEETSAKVKVFRK
jgi:predicted transcriptional regulator